VTGERTAVELARTMLMSLRTDDHGAASVAAGRLAALTEADLARDLAADAARTATWINLYNAATQRLVDADPAAFAKRARFFRQRAMTVAGTPLSLDAIEHGLLRGSRPKVGLGYLSNPFAGRFERRFRVRRPDPRVHFALNCAAGSCPPIAAYDPDRLDAQLDLAARVYLTAMVRVEGETLTIPRIFRWFPGDFRSAGGVRGFLSAHGVAAEGRRLRHAPWDWTPAPDRWMDGVAGAWAEARDAHDRS
jgi:hypothetical protein